MKIGLLTSILENMSFEQMMDMAADKGFACVEVACWPAGQAERRYAGVSHIDVNKVLEDDGYAEYILEYSRKNGVEISALAFYPNTLDGDMEKRSANISHLKQVIKASAKLQVNLVTTFIGRDQYKTIEDNFRVVAQEWPSIMRLAEDLNVKVAIENCPMLFGADQWPGGQNIMTSPANWEKVFEIIDSPNLGINYDPSHFVWQMMDYIRPLYKFKDKIFHVHFKDIKVFEDQLDEVGIMAYPLEFMEPKLPGLGDINWSRFVSALTDIGYEGCACIEVEDRAFESSDQRVLDSICVSKRYLSQYVI